MKTRDTLKNIEETLLVWSKKKINNKQSFDDSFKIDDNIPIWWFHSFRFNAGCFPLPFFEITKRFNAILDKRDYSFFHRLMMKLASFSLRIFLSVIIFTYYIRLIKKKDVKKKSKKTKKKRVMLLAHTDQIKLDEKRKIIDIFRIGELFRRLEKDNKIELIPVIGTRITNPFEKPLSSGYYHWIDKYISKETFYRSLKEAKKYSGKWKRLDKKIKERLFAYKKESLLKFVNEELDLLFSKQILFIYLLYYYTIKDIIKKEQLDLVLVVSGLQERCAVAAAHSSGIPSLFLVHAYNLTGINFEFFPSSKIAVWGPNDKKRLIKYSEWKPENIFVTGSFINERICNYIKKKEKKKGKKKILILSSPLVQFKVLPKEKFEKYLFYLFSNLKEFPDSEIIIKTHPLEKDISLHKKIIKKIGIKNIRFRFGSLSNKNADILYNSILESDLVISFGSTALIEAMILNRPCILLKFESGENLFENMFDGISSIFIVKHGDKLNELIKKMLFDENFRESINEKRKNETYEYCYKTDGKANDRLIKAINSILKKR
ncbi:hypothetical protein JXB41_00150 [Candidatus Woesearchaeota archaeon]|nr:hypothetical protein [Candidatus Woesearchaeota archaeon]